MTLNRTTMKEEKKKRPPNREQGPNAAIATRNTDCGKTQQNVTTTKHRRRQFVFSGSRSLPPDGGGKTYVAVRHVYLSEGMVAMVAMPQLLLRLRDISMKPLLPHDTPHEFLTMYMSLVPSVP